MPLANQLTMDLVEREGIHEGWDSKFEGECEYSTYYYTHRAY